MDFDVMNIVYYCAVILLATKLLGMFTGSSGHFTIAKSIPRLYS